MSINQTHSYIVERHADGSVSALARRAGESGADYDAPLDPRRDLANESDDGRFDVGFPGSGAAQLAVALLADAFEVPLNDEIPPAASFSLVLTHYAGLSRSLLARIGGGATGGPFRWEITRAALIRLVEKAQSRGWDAVAEEFDRNRAYAPEHVGEQAFRRTKS